MTGAATTTTPTAPAAWEQLSARLRDELPASSFLSLFASAVPVSIDETGALTVALSNAFCVSQARRHRAEIEEWSAAAGLASVDFVAREQIGLPSVELQARPDPLTEAREAQAQHERQARNRRAVERQREQPPGVITRLLAERGYWSLDPSAQLTLFEVDDLHGALQVLPSPLGSPGTYEATVFTGLLTLWAGGDRAERSVQTSLKGLADLLSLSWSGRTASQLRDAIEVLMLTGYRVVVQNENGGWSDLFSLLDRVQTRWDGPASSPHRHVRAVFSEATWEAISQPRVLRPVDLPVLHAIGEQRQLARRLFLFLEGIPMHRLNGGHETVDRIIDERLAATLGARSAMKHLRSQLPRAGTAIVTTAPRYHSIEVVPRAKRGLRRGEPSHLLRVVRSQLAASR